VPGWEDPEVNEFCGQHNLEFIATSAIEGYQVKEVFQAMGKKLLERGSQTSRIYRQTSIDEEFEEEEEKGKLFSCC
jgi:hypothetical protein